MYKFFQFIFLILLCYSCATIQLPELYYNASQIGYSQKITGDSLHLFITNPLKCPIRIMLSDDSLNDRLEDNGIATVGANSNKSFRILLKKNEKVSSGIKWRLGNPIDKPVVESFVLPFLNGKKYKIIQGYEGKFSHNEGLAKYAIDFNLQIGDTICAADEGFVVALVKDYSKSGTTKQWRGFSNFITIYNPKSGVFTEYAHLKQNGSLVNMGDFVAAGSPIAVAGMTGWTTTPHLHFVSYFRNKNWDSEPIKVIFSEHYKGEDLKEDDFVERSN